MTTTGSAEHLAVAARQLIDHLDLHHLACGGIGDGVRSMSRHPGRGGGTPRWHVVQDGTRITITQHPGGEHIVTVRRLLGWVDGHLTDHDRRTVARLVELRSDALHRRAGAPRQAVVEHALDEVMDALCTRLGYPPSTEGAA